MAITNEVKVSDVQTCVLWHRHDAFRTDVAQQRTDAGTLLVWPHADSTAHLTRLCHCHENTGDVALHLCITETRQ